MRRTGIRTRTLGRGPALTELGLGTPPFGNLFRKTTDEDATPRPSGVGRRGPLLRHGAALRPRARRDATGQRARDRTARRLRDLDEGGSAAGADPRARSRAGRRRLRRAGRDRGGSGTSVATGSCARSTSSLERLGLDDVDIVYLHDPDDHWAEASTTGIDALIELREQGVIRRDRRRHEPVRHADRVRAALRRRHHHAGGAVHLARPVRAGRPAAPRAGTRRRRGCRGRVQLGSAGARPRSRTTPISSTRPLRRNWSPGRARSPRSASGTA